MVYNVTRDAEEFTCNVWLVPGEVPTLVDAGTMPGVVDAIREHVDDLDRVVLTHGHGDHVGRLDEVLDAFDADLYAYRDWERCTRAVDDGDRLAMGDDTYEVVYTPGHADDHVALAGERALFSGDVVVYNDGAFDDGSFGRTDLAGQSRERLVESVDELIARTPDSVRALYAGHGDACDGDVHAVLERALERAERHEPKYPE
jgi:glyoxylase-like metal-dependent hydrolase (beta-lactamase superfamily II)